MRTYSNIKNHHLFFPAVVTLKEFLVFLELQSVNICVNIIYVWACLVTRDDGGTSHFAVEVPRCSFLILLAVATIKDFHLEPRHQSSHPQSYQSPFGPPKSVQILNETP